MKFGDALAGAVFFGELARKFTGYKEELEAAAVIVEKTARSLPGEYQDGWPALAESTIKRKSTGDSPLFETGELRDSITHSSDDREATVGTNVDHAIFSEVGTVHEPPRPIFPIAAIKATAEVEAAVGKVVMSRLGA